MEIMIMGYGVVGQAVATILADKGHLPIPYDPPKGLDKVDPAEVDVAFICVSAPTMGDGFVDISAIRDCLKKLRKGATAIIRSTIPPGTTDQLQHDFPALRVFFVPEFLTEATAEHDAHYPTRILIGVPKGGVREPSDLATVHELMKPSRFILPDERIVIMTAVSAEMAKYVANSFYALKVAFFNEVADVCERNGADFEDVRRSVAKDPWTGAQHTDIWHGGYRGYGGKCLPKDVAAFVQHARGLGFPMLTLEAAEIVNESVRFQRKPPESDR